MNTSIKVEHILSQIKQLDGNARLYLVEMLVKLLAQNPSKALESSTNITHLNSLGSELWKDINPDNYVHQERLWD
jgi:hypothetical protein